MLKKLQKKIAIFLLFTMLASLCISENSIKVQAAEDTVTYCFAQKDGGEAKWYVGDPVIGYEEEISTGAMQKDENTIYYICAAPTPELNSFLQSLSSARAINFFECGAGSVSFGDAASPISLGSMQICDPNIDVTATVSNIGRLSVDKGSVTVNGNISNLQLGYDGELFPSGTVTQNATINGNVESLTWYNDPSLDKLSFKGNCTVTGTVSYGEIKEPADLPDFGKIYPITRTFSNVSNMSIITNGVLNPSISCEGVDDLDTATITYEYHCYCWKGWTGNYWELYAYADGYPLGSKYLDGFNPATDIPANADVFICGTYGSDPITISNSLDTLSIDSGNVNVTGDIKSLVTTWYYPDDTLYATNANINVNGNVSDLYLFGSCKEVNVTVNGNVTYGERIIGTTPRFFSSDGSVKQLMKNGELMVMTNDSSDYDGINYLLPSTSNIENAIGITENDNITDASGNLIATKTASVTISQLDTVSNEEANLFNQIEDSSVISWMNVDVSSFYQSTYGSIYEDANHKTEKIYELNTPISITFEIPVEHQDPTADFAVLRNHNGTITKLEDTDTNPNTVTFATDRFSTYALTKVTNDNSKPEEAPKDDSDNNSESSEKPSSKKEDNSSTQNTQISAPEYYTVLRGDNLNKIAKKHNMTLAQLVALNPQIRDINLIYPGQRITVKQGMTTNSVVSTDSYHIVRSGDSLYKLCKQYRLTLSDILEKNTFIKNPNLIYIGQRIRIK